MKITEQRQMSRGSQAVAAHLHNKCLWDAAKVFISMHPQKYSDA